MSRLTLLRGLLLNFKEEIGPRRRDFLPKKEAYLQLKYHTGEDFGDNISKWEEWIKKHPESIKTKEDTKSRVARYLME